MHGVSGLAPAIRYSDAIMCVMGFGLAPAITEEGEAIQHVDKHLPNCAKLFSGRGGSGSQGREKHCYSKKREGHGISRHPQCHRDHHRVREEES